jgi:glyoxylate carboligase
MSALCCTGIASTLNHDCSSLPAVAAEAYNKSQGGAANAYNMLSLLLRKDGKDDICHCCLLVSTVTAAEAYNKSQGERLCAVMTTSGPGATNLCTGIASAWRDGVPMIVITSQVCAKLFCLLLFCCFFVMLLCCVELFCLM